jgi:hypothetical protein
MSSYVESTFVYPISRQRTDIRLEANATNIWAFFLYAHKCGLRIGWLEKKTIFIA